MTAAELPSPWPRTFRALRHRNFRLFWASDVISSTGTWMQTVALGWLVYRLTDSPLMLGVINVVALVPVVPFSLLAGVMSDRFPRRPLILISESLTMIQVFVLALLTWLNVVQVWHVIVLTFGLALVAAMEQPARLAFVKDTVGRNDLTNAVALNASARNASRVVGPALAGVLIAWLGEALCFFLNGLSYLPVIGAVVAIRLPAARQTKEPLSAAGGLLDGFTYIRRTPVIRALMSIVAISSFFTLPYVALMPVFADDVLGVGAQGLGYLTAAVGIGAAVGALGVANIRMETQERWLAWGGLAASVLLIGFCLSRSYFASLVLIFLVAAGNIVRQALSNSLLQLRSDEAYHGRVMSVFNLLFVGMTRLGALAAGALAEYLGAPLAVGLGAAVSLVWGVYIAWRMPHRERGV
ncbi:MAG: MFS transporter [Chloroflexota bacterium]